MSVSRCATETAGVSRALQPATVLDQQFDDERHAFVYTQPERGGEPIELAPEPSWNRVAYGKR